MVLKLCPWVKSTSWVYFLVTGDNICPPISTVFGGYEGDSRHENMLPEKVPSNRPWGRPLTVDSCPFPAFFTAPTMTPECWKSCSGKHSPLWIHSHCQYLIRWAPVCVNSPINSLFVLNLSSGNSLQKYSLTSHFKEGKENISRWMTAFSKHTA